MGKTAARKSEKQSALSRVLFVIAILMAVPVIGVFYFSHGSSPNGPRRGPASDIYNDDGEIVMSEESIDSLSRTHDEGRRVKPHSLRLFRGEGRELSDTEATRRAGHAVRRAREMDLDYDAFIYAVKTEDRVVIVPLFNDKEIYVRLRVPSVLRVNQGVYSGIVDGDEGSQVHLFAADGQLSGVIETSTRRYRLLPHPNGRETVTEEPISRTE